MVHGREVLLFLSSRRRHTRCALVTGVQTCALPICWRFPVTLQSDVESDAETVAFSFYGPTCDDLDHMAGPFFLPADIKAGDFIEIGMLGAYGCAMRTKFNGFGADETHVEIGRAHV